MDSVWMGGGGVSPAAFRCFFSFFFAMFPEWRVEREQSWGDDWGDSLLQINNCYKWASLIWVMIESLLICLVADERKEEGGGCGVGEVD